MGVNIKEQPDGFIIKGQADVLRGARVESKGDHRIAMSLAVAALAAEGDSTIGDTEAVNISFPRFWDLFDALSS